MNLTCSATPCPVILNSTCVFYEGENLLCTGINTNDSLQTVLEKLETAICANPPLYIFQNGITQTSNIVELGGDLINVTDIEFTTGDLTFSHSSGSYTFFYPGFIFNYDNGLGGSLVQINAQGGLPAYFSTNTIDPLENNTVETTLFLSRSTSNTPGVGIGASINCQVQGFDASSIITKLTTILPNVTSSIEFYNLLNGISTRKAVIAGTGQWTWDKYGVGTFVDTPVYLLGVKADGSVVETSQINISASNGLTESPANNIILGGTLTQNTTITGGAFNTRFTSTAASTPAIYGSNFLGANSIGVRGAGNVSTGIGVLGGGYYGFKTDTGVVIGADIRGNTIGVEAYSSNIPLRSTIDATGRNGIINPGLSVRYLDTTVGPAPLAGTGIGTWAYLQDDAGTERKVGVSGYVLTNGTPGNINTLYQHLLYSGAATETYVHGILFTGQHILPLYGTETFTGTVATTLGVTSTGWVVEEPVCYLAAHDESDQPAVAATATPMEFDTTDLSYNITITGVNNTDITFPKAGIYNIQFSAQLIRTTGGTGTVSVWLAKYNSGTGLWDNVPNSNTDYQISGNNEPFVAILNYMENATLNDKYRIYWSSSDGNVIIEHKNAQVTPDRPATPSIILTVWKIA